MDASSMATRSFKLKTSLNSFPFLFQLLGGLLSQAAVVVGARGHLERVAPMVLQDLQEFKALKERTPASKARRAIREASELKAI